MPKQNLIFVYFNSNSDCTDTNFECNTGECISYDLVCDGMDDCYGGEDETDCGK